MVAHGVSRGFGPIQTSSALKGRHFLSLEQVRMPDESCLGCVAPPGLRGVSGQFPTAHAVGYHLPPSGLKIKTRGSPASAGSVKKRLSLDSARSKRSVRHLKQESHSHAGLSARNARHEGVGDRLCP